MHSDPAELTANGNSGESLSGSPPRLLNRATMIESLAVLLIGISLMHFFYAGTGGVLGDERGVPGHDSFYHIKMAELLPQRGLLHQFEWLKFCYFTDEGQDFVSHHYGFHVLLAPFVALSQRLTGDTLAGARWAIMTTFGLNLVLFNLLLISEGVRWRWVWLMFFLLLPFQFFTRHAYVRAIAPSLTFMLLITLLMFRRRHVLTGLAVMAYTHLYLGGVIYAPVLVVLFVFSCIAAPRRDRYVPWRLIIFSLSGWTLGIVLHPYRDGMVEFLRLQVFGSGLSPDISVGREWKPYKGVWWFAQMSGTLLIVWSAALALRLRFGERIGAKTLMLLLAHFAFLTLTFKARRFIEYWPMFCLLSAAYLANPILQRAAVSIQRSINRVPDFRSAAPGLAIAFAVVLGLMFSALHVSSSPSVKPFMDQRFVWLLLVVVYILATVVIPRLTAHPIALTPLVQRTRALYVGITAAGFVAASISFAAHPLCEVQRKSRCGYDLPAIRGAMAFLEANSQPGDVVFTDDWDVFPVFFHYNTHNHYVVGLDPKFTHARRPDLWERYVKISRGQVPADVFVDMPAEDGKKPKRRLHIELQDIREHFGASYVVTDRDHKPLAKMLSNAQGFSELVYPSSDYEASQDEPYLIFRIQSGGSDADGENAPTANVPQENVVYLSSLNPVSAAQGWGDLVADRSVGGGPIRLGKRVYPKGLGTHAPSKLEYEIPAGFAHFEAMVGVDHDTTGRGSVIVSVYLDGERRFQSGVLTGVSDAVPIRIPLGSARRLLLEANPTPDGKQHDHLDWADARFTR